MGIVVEAKNIKCFDVVFIISVTINSDMCLFTLIVFSNQFLVTPIPYGIFTT